MPILPYMFQLPQDFYLHNLPVPVVPVSTPVVPVVPEITIPPSTAVQSGGAWYGDVPPDSPESGWLWVNPANNGLYIFTEDGFWTHIGTNW